MSGIIVIGSGPAGITAAIYAVRAGIGVTVIGRDGGALSKAEKIENYYGFKEPIAGAELIHAGIVQAERLGVSVIKDEVVGININDENKFIVKAVSGEHTGDCVVLATGMVRTVPNIKGIDIFEGKGISYCAVCDAFFYRGKDVAVLGCGEYALSETLELSRIVKFVTILSNGDMPLSGISELTRDIDNVKIIDTPVTEFVGGTSLERVLFSDGSTIAVSGAFIAVGVAGSTDFARKLGAEIINDKIIIDENMSAGIPGLYAAGDCTGGMPQIAKAVYEGAKAGTQAVKYIRNK